MNKDEEQQEYNEIFYSDVRYVKEPAPILKKLAKYYTFKDLVLTSFDEYSHAIGFGDAEDMLIPKLFKDMKLFNIGMLEIADGKEIDLHLFEELVMDYFVLQTEEFDNVFKKIYEGSSFSSEALEKYKNHDMENNFGMLDKKNDFISMVENEKGQKRIFCHSLGTELIEKCIEDYSLKAETYIKQQKKVRLDVLNSANPDPDLREGIKQELSQFTVERGLEFLPRYLVADFKRDFQKCIVINYMSAMSILLLINDVFNLSGGPPKMYNQISDHYTYDTLHINFRLLLPQQKAMVFNPSTFDFALVQNISETDKPLPLCFKNEKAHDLEDKRVPEKKDRMIWVDYNEDNPLYFSESYNSDLLSEVDSESYSVIEKLKPIFIYAN